MTHFIAAVLVPAGVPTTVTEQTVKRPYGGSYKEHKANHVLEVTLAAVLERFNENREVDEYEETDYNAAQELTKAQGWYKDHPEDMPSGGFANDLEVLNAYHGGGWKKIGTKSGFRYAKFTTYNPESKWDWYVPVGRWSDIFPLDGHTVFEFRELVAAEREKLRAIAPTPSTDVAVVEEEATPDWLLPNVLVVPGITGGVAWLEAGSHGWFGSLDRKDTEIEWAEKVHKATETFSDNSRIVYVDFHI